VFFLSRYSLIKLLLFINWDNSISIASERLLSSQGILICSSGPGSKLDHVFPTVFFHKTELNSIIIQGHLWPSRTIFKKLPSLSCDLLPCSTFPFTKIQNGLKVGLSRYELRQIEKVR